MDISELEQGFRDLATAATDRVRELEAENRELKAVLSEYRLINRPAPVPAEPATHIPLQIQVAAPATEPVPPKEKKEPKLYQYQIVCGRCHNICNMESTASKPPKYCRACRPLAQSEHMKVFHSARQTAAVFQEV